MKKRSKVLVGFLVLALLLTAMIGATGTGAWFRDSAKSQGNTIVSGTLDLTVDDNNDAVIHSKISASNLAPGAWDNNGHITVTNVGTLPGKLSIKINNIQNIENGINAPEAVAGDTTNDIGELGSKLAISAQENVAPWTRYSIMSGLTNGATLSTEGRVLQPGESIQIVFYTVWGQTDTDNVAQGDSVTFDTLVDLDQIH